MHELTHYLRAQAPAMDRAFVDGIADGGEPVLRRRAAEVAWDMVRVEWDLAPCHPPLLTPPTANRKLAKATVPTYGICLQHHIQRVTPKLVINTCPNAGHCTAVCVLDTGMGRFHSVQIARRAKTAFLVQQPLAFSYLLGGEYARAARRHPEGFLCRPNINSDVAWEQLLPSMTGGAFVPSMTCLGYTKRPDVLGTNGWVDDASRVAYSLNETSNYLKVALFLKRGGSVSIVTDRRKGQPVHRLAQFDAPVVDADLTDEWIFAEGTIGDLSAKGRARRLIGRSNFILMRGTP